MGGALQSSNMLRRNKLTAVIWKEGRRFVSKCPELGVASYGNTPEDARAALKKALVLYLENVQALAETLEIVSDKRLMANLRRGLGDVKAGRLIPWEDVKRKLG